jgi:hypothetical protein
MSLNINASRHEHDKVSKCKTPSHSVDFRLFFFVTPEDGRGGETVEGSDSGGGDSGSCDLTPLIADLR